MARQTVRSRRPRQQSKGGGVLRSTALLALGFTLGLGAAATFALYINKVPIPFRDPPTRSDDVPGEDNTERTRRETLEFHETLLERRAVPSAEPEEKTPAPVTAPVPAQATDGTVYYLQLGAFSGEDAAEQLRGELALSGAQTIVRSGKVSGRQVFRVLMGPYNSIEAADETRARLVLNGHTQVKLLKSSSNGE